MVLHIFLKDVHRLWWAVLATWVPLAALACLDRWRIDWVVSSPEGWLNLLLPLAWVCLIAMVVQEEPLADQGHFWTTWPYRWPVLLGAKVLFVATFIHLPALVTDSAVVASHGFSPWESLRPLLWKQAVLAAVLIVPAMALASVCRRITHFVVAAILIFGGAAYLAAFSGQTAPWITPDELRWEIPAMVLALAAGLVIVLQYSRRRTMSSRVVGAVAMAVATVLFACLTPSLTARLRMSLHPQQAELSLRLGASLPEPPQRLLNVRGLAAFVVVALPATLPMAPEGSELLLGPPLVEIVGADGGRLQSVIPSPSRRPGPSDLIAYVDPTDHGQGWLVLRIPRRVMAQFQDGPVAIRGRSTVSFVGRGETTWMPVGANAPVPGLGRCVSEGLDGQGVDGGGMLKVLCESLAPVSSLTEVRLWSPGTGRTWRHHLGDSAPVVYGPREAWLSPLHRLQTYFHLAEAARMPQSGSGWLVPPEVLTGARLAITPGSITGSAVMSIDIQHVALRDYVVTSAR